MSNEERIRRLVVLLRRLLPAVTWGFLALDRQRIEEEISEILRK